MTHSLFIITAAFALAFVQPGSAKDFNDLQIGEIACYDRFGPFNVIGRVVDRNPSNGHILLENNKGRKKWYPASKFRNVASCKLTAKAVDWLAEQAKEELSN